MAINKKLLWIGIGSAVLVGGGFLWWYLSSKSAKDAGTGETDKDKDKDTGGELPPPTPTGESLPATPFKNKVEGNAFRVWMKDKYPTFSDKGEKLDLDGKYDNNTIRKAYQLYGVEYAKTTADKIPTPTYVNGSKVFINPKQSNVTLYSLPEIKAEYIKGKVNKSDALDRPFGIFINSPKSGWLKITVPTYRKVDNTIVANKSDFYVQAVNVAPSPF